MKLNVIGNGFDLYHGLPSSYYFFGCYLIEKDPEFFESLGKIYNLKNIRLTEPLIAHDYEYVLPDIFWREFERFLGDVNESFIIESLEDDLRLENDDPVEREMDEYEIAEKLKKHFSQWVIDTLDQNINYDIIRETIDIKYLLNLNRSDYYLFFNYTHVLQNLYDIPDERIIYIHGESNEDHDDEIIVGHGNEHEIEYLQTKIYELEELFDYEQSSMNRIEEHKCLLRYIEILKKDVSLCKYRADSFYKSFNNTVDTVCVYGLSLGDVDMPYLKQIHDKWPKANWKFSFYSDEDQKRVTNVVTKDLKIDKNKYSTFQLFNENSSIIKKMIIDIQKINLIEPIPSDLKI